VNVLALAIGASRHPGVDAIVAAARELGGPAGVPIPGRGDRADAHFAALATGFAAHVDDFDDTHLATVIHPGAACMAVLVRALPETASSGEAALRAFAVGCEAQLRTGVAISPEHYDRGWHITGTCGVIGAAVTAALLFGFDDAALAQAVRLSATMTLGQRDCVRTMTKAFHPGKAAANGILAARLAAQGADAPAGVIEDPRGSRRALDALRCAADAQRARCALGALGEHLQAVSVRDRRAPPRSTRRCSSVRTFASADVVELRAHCHPLVPS